MDEEVALLKQQMAEMKRLHDEQLLQHFHSFNIAFEQEQQYCAAAEANLVQMEQKYQAAEQRAEEEKQERLAAAKRYSQLHREYYARVKARARDQKRERQALMMMSTIFCCSISFGKRADLVLQLKYTIVGDAVVSSSLSH